MIMYLPAREMTLSIRWVFVPILNTAKHFRVHITISEAERSESQHAVEILWTSITPLALSTYDSSRMHDRYEKDLCSMIRLFSALINIDLLCLQKQSIEV